MNNQEVNHPKSNQTPMDQLHKFGVLATFALVVAVGGGLGLYFFSMGASAFPLFVRVIVCLFLPYGAIFAVKTGEFRGLVIGLGAVIGAAMVIGLGVEISPNIDFKTQFEKDIKSFLDFGVTIILPLFGVLCALTLPFIFSEKISQTGKTNDLVEVSRH